MLLVLIISIRNLTLIDGDDIINNSRINDFNQFSILPTIVHNRTHNASHQQACPHHSINKHNWPLKAPLKQFLKSSSKTKEKKPTWFLRRFITRHVHFRCATRSFFFGLGVSFVYLGPGAARRLSESFRLLGAPRPIVHAIQPPWSDTDDIVEADSGVRIVFLMLFFGRHWGNLNVGVRRIWSRRVGIVGVKTRPWTRRYVVRAWGIWNRRYTAVQTWRRRVRVCWDY